MRPWGAEAVIPAKINGTEAHLIADSAAALKLRPKTAWSLFGRGQAELRKGLKAQGEADVAAAIALDPKVQEQAKRFGLVS